MAERGPFTERLRQKLEQARADIAKGPVSMQVRDRWLNDVKSYMAAELGEGHSRLRALDEATGDVPGYCARPWDPELGLVGSDDDCSADLAEKALSLEETLDGWELWPPSGGDGPAKKRGDRTSAKVENTFNPTINFNPNITAQATASASAEATVEQAWEEAFRACAALPNGGEVAQEILEQVRAELMANKPSPGLRQKIKTLISCGDKFFIQVLPALLQYGQVLYPILTGGVPPPLV